MKVREPVPDLNDQDHQWSRHAARYDEVFLDAFHPGVENPLMVALEAISDPGDKTVIDLGCGTGPLLSYLVGRFGRVIALDFAPAMITRARHRLGRRTSTKVEFLNRSMHDLKDLKETLDVAIAVNSLVMPDVRLIDQTLSAVRASLKSSGVFLGVVPSMDAIHYHTMLLMDQSLDRGATPEEAERYAAFHGEHGYYEFAFGRFGFQGLKQKFWQPFELRHRLSKAGFRSLTLDQLLYPWDESITGGAEFSDHPKSWDWTFHARP